jgi:hypothetical protein
VQLPDVEVTWPLRRPPALLPHLELDADARADCEPSSQHFHAIYTAAWCLARKGERVQAAERLAAVADTLHGDDQRAVLFDIGEWIADVMPARDAIAWLGRVRLPPLMWDVLIATYAENSDPDSARALLDARPAFRDDALSCGRAIVDATFADTDARWSRAMSVAAGASCGMSLATLVCRHELALAHASQDERHASALVYACAPYLGGSRDKDAIGGLVHGYAEWPSGSTSWYTWTRDAEDAVHALALRGAAELAVTALENASYVANCSPSAVENIANLTAAIAGPSLSADLQRRLARVNADMASCPH